VCRSFFYVLFEKDQKEFLLFFAPKKRSKWLCSFQKEHKLFVLFQKGHWDMPPFHEMEGFFAKKKLTFFGSMKGNA